MKTVINERNTMIDFRKSILAEMKLHKISIPKMARIAECNQQTLYDYFSGRTALGADSLAVILNHLGGQLSFRKSQTRG